MILYNLKNISERIIQNKKETIGQSVTTLNKDVISKIGFASLTLQQQKTQILSISKQLMKSAAEHINSLERNIQNMDPKNVLKRGYSITRIEGKSINNTDGLEKGQKIETILSQGKIFSTITQTENESN